MRVFPVSVEGYHELGRLGVLGKNVELLEGVIVEKMSKSSLHQAIVRRLQRLLEKIVPSGFYVDREAPITCVDSEPEPDVGVYAGDPEVIRLTHPSTAELVIEVSIHTLQKDRLKAAIYAKAGVKEYWLVEPENDLITIHAQLSPTGYGLIRQYKGSDLAQSEVLPMFAVKPAEFFA